MFDRKSYLREYYQKHRDVLLKRQIVYNKSHPEVLKRAQRRHNVRHPEIRRRAAHKHYSRNKRYYYRKAAEWLKAHPEVHRIHQHRRRTQTKSGDLTVSQWLELVEECGGMCVICHAPYEHLDHIIPLSKGGKHTLSNVQPLCAKCNQSKGSTL